MRQQAAMIEGTLAACSSAVALIGSKEPAKAIAPATQLAEALKRAGKRPKHNVAPGMAALMRWSKHNG